jgi:hypothetical protein
MKDDFKRWELEVAIKSEIADCMQYEAFKKIDFADAKLEKCHTTVFTAFLILGRVKSLLGKDFEEVREELYDKAKAKFLPVGASEAEVKHAMEAGLSCGEMRSLSVNMGLRSFHYGFVAEMVWPEIYAYIRYVEDRGWEVWENRTWRRRPKEKGIVGIIYKVMREKINTWREALEDLSDINGTGGWIGRLEKNINDPDWLSKVEELLLKIDYFNVLVEASDD